jgi:hypothetical protein
MRSFLFLLFPLIIFAAESSRKRANQACKAGVFEVKIRIDEQPEILAEFNAKLLKLPNGDNERGWMFKIASPSSLLREIFVESGEEFYLPYRQVNAFTGN